MKKTYITTSIAYTNAPPHIGFALELVQADVMARHYRSQGRDVFFLTGTDEHGIKINLKAQEEKKKVEEFTDQISGQFQELTRKLNVSNDDFIRTTDQEKHWPGVFKMWQAIKKDIYLKKYQGLYCVGCETFLMKKDLIDGKCIYHQKEPEVVQEENYFFRLSKYADLIKEKIENDSIKIIPEKRKNETLSFLKQGLKDVSFSRPKEKVVWGIPLPEDPSHLIYCWADALTNYLSALGYGRNNDYQDFWPADIHFIGKDIFKFHALIWPGMLLSAGLDLPKKIFIHGFITVNGQKMSKSLNNVVDPLDLIERYGTDAFRHYFLSEISPTEDGDFSEEKFKARYNADLAGGIGNLLARVVVLSKEVDIKKATEEIIERVKETEEKRVSFLEEFKFNSCLAEIYSLIKFADQYIEKNKPWQKKEDSFQVVSNLVFIVKEIARMINPFMPEASEKMLQQIESRKSEILFKKV
jgi:methionyl-tRNA synthetase